MPNLLLRTSKHLFWGALFWVPLTAVLAVPMQWVSNLGSLTPDHGYLYHWTTGLAIMGGVCLLTQAVTFFHVRFHLVPRLARQWGASLAEIDDAIAAGLMKQKGFEAWDEDTFRSFQVSNQVAQATIPDLRG